MVERSQVSLGVGADQVGTDLDGQVPEDGGVASFAQWTLARGVELLQCVLTHEGVSSEQRVAVIHWNGSQEALVDERDEPVEREDAE